MSSRRTGRIDDMDVRLTSSPAMSNPRGKPVNLTTEPASMPRASPMNTPPEPAAPTAAVEFGLNGCRWRVLTPRWETFRSDAVDWFHLEDAPEARRVKSNGQRDVWYVRHDGREYFAKLYHPTGLGARIKLLFRGPTAVREWDVGRYAAAFGVATVRPAACAWTVGDGHGGRRSLLLTEAVPDALPLNDYWQAIRHDRRVADALCETLARLIARAHQAGFRHGDMHPGNIIVRPQRHTCELFFVDLHKVVVGRPVSLRSVVANLAQLNQWFRRHSTRSQRLRFLRHYLHYRDRFAQASSYARNWRIEPRRLAAHLARQANRHADRLWAKRDRRMSRTGRYYARIRPAPGWRGHVMLCSKHPAPAASAARLTYTKRQWTQWLADPLAWVDPARHELIKDSHTATICRARLPVNEAPAEVVVKRTLARNAWKRLTQMFGRSRNLRAWRMANMLLHRDLPAAQPLAVVERHVAGLVRLDSVLLTEFIPGAVDLETFLTRVVAAMPAAAQWGVKDHLTEALVGLLRSFHARGFVHRDLKAPNVLVNWEPPYRSAPVLTFIDMDGISHVRRPSAARELRAVVRLGVSLLACPVCTRTDRLRFLLRYLTGPGRSPGDWKDRWRLIEHRTRLKLRDKAVRRRWKLDHYGRE